MIFSLNFFLIIVMILDKGILESFFGKIERLYENLKSETEMLMVKPMEYLELNL